MADSVDIRVEREMQAPAAAVWGVLSDLARLPEWLEFVSELSERSGDEVVEGATYKVKPPHFYEPRTSWRVATVEAPHRQVHTSKMPMLRDVSSEIAVEEAGDRARVRVHWQGEPANFMGRMMRGMFTKQVTAQWERSLAKLDEVAART